MAQPTTATERLPGAQAATVPEVPEVPRGVDHRAWSIRRRVLEHTISNGGGYLSQACSAAEIFACLYSGLMRLGPSAGAPVPEGFRATPGEDASVRLLGADYNGRQSDTEDRFLMSPAHYALVLYAALIEAGRLDPAALEDFNHDGSTVEMIGAEHSPGMEATTGSLGQALAVVIGRALARRRRGVTSRLWVLCSDGELQEGEMWESFALASAYHLSEITMLIDANGSQCDGPVNEVLAIEPIAGRLSAFGWEVCEVDGHCPKAIWEAASADHGERPLAVVCRTRPHAGIPSLVSRAPKFHYLRLGPDEAARARADLEACRPDPGGERAGPRLPAEDLSGGAVASRGPA